MLHKRENGTLTLKLCKKCGKDDKTVELKAGDLSELKKEILKVL